MQWGPLEKVLEQKQNTDGKTMYSSNRAPVLIRRIWQMYHDDVRWSPQWKVSLGEVNSLYYLCKLSANMKLFKNLKVYLKNFQVLTTDSLVRVVSSMVINLISSWRDAFMLVSLVLCVQYSRRTEIDFSHQRQPTKASAQHPMF